MSKISIVGCGWLGLPLAKRLVEEGYQVLGSTTRAERFSELTDIGVKPYQLKAENGKWLGEDLTEFLDCDILIIAIPPGTKRNPQSLHAEEIEALMQHISEFNIHIEKVIYISSTSVYKNRNQIVVEGDVNEDVDAENKILARAERFVLSSGINEKLILRLGGLTGYERMLARFFAGKQDLVGGNEPVNLVHRDDVISSILFLFSKKINNAVINVCSPQHPTRKDFYSRLCDRFDLPQPTFPTHLNADWKEVSSDKLSDMGYRWLFPDPYQYTY